MVGRGSLGSGISRCRWWWPVHQEAHSSSPGKMKRQRWPSRSQSPARRSTTFLWYHGRFLFQLEGRWDCIVKNHTARQTLEKFCLSVFSTNNIKTFTHLADTLIKATWHAFKMFISFCFSGNQTHDLCIMFYYYIYTYNLSLQQQI